MVSSRRSVAYITDSRNTTHPWHAIPYLIKDRNSFKQACAWFRWATITLPYQQSSFAWSSGDANDQTEERHTMYDDKDMDSKEAVHELRLHPRLRMFLSRPMLGERFPQQRGQGKVKERERPESRASSSTSRANHCLTPSTTTTSRFNKDHDDDHNDKYQEHRYKNSKCSRSRCCVSRRSCSCQEAGSHRKATVQGSGCAEEEISGGSQGQDGEICMRARQRPSLASPASTALRWRSRLYFISTSKHLLLVLNTTRS